MFIYQIGCHGSHKSLKALKRQKYEQGQLQGQAQSTSQDLATLTRPLQLLCSMRLPDLPASLQSTNKAIAQVIIPCNCKTFINA